MRKTLSMTILSTDKFKSGSFYPLIIMITYSSIVRIKTKKSYLFTVRGLYFRMDERHML